jgi:hypothetical protein
MSWTYLSTPFAGDPYASPPVIPTAQNNRDSVRFLIGDIDPTDPQLQDSEVDGLLNANCPTGSLLPNTYLAACQACLSLAARYTRKASMSVGDLSIQYGAVSNNYRSLEKTIRAQAQRHLVVTPYAGGISIADMEIDQDNQDIVQPWVTVGFTDNEGAAPDFGSCFQVNVPDG